MDWSPSCNSREALGFSQIVIFIKCWAGLRWQAYKLELVDISQRNQADKFEWCVKFLRKSVGIFGYFGKFFDYGLQFSFSPVVVVQLLSCVWLFVIPGLQHVRLPFTISWSLLKLMSIVSVMPSNHLILCRPLLLLPSIFPSIRVCSLLSQLFTSGAQSVGASVSLLVLQWIFRVDLLWDWLVWSI